MLSHEASITGTNERAEMKMIEFSMPRKLLLPVLTAAFNHTAPRMVKRGSRFNELACVLVRLGHVASVIVGANHDIRWPTVELRMSDEDLHKN